jgi:holo-[acyl-carrier protein] synthase
MIVAIGSDIVEHEIAKNLKWETSAQIQERIFSAKELEHYNFHKKIKFLCGRFAAKEAVLKCLSSGMKDGISLKDIEILQHDNGKPYILLASDLNKLSKDFGIKKWHISITHSKSYSQAFVIAEG